MNSSVHALAALLMVWGCGQGASTSGVPRPSNPTNDANVPIFTPDTTKPPTNPPASGPACVDVSLGALPTCCDSGPARCVPADQVAPRIVSFLQPCADGSICVPENIFGLKGEYTPLECTSVGGVPGACMTRCLPGVQGFIGLLPQAICAEGDVCIPCVNPLDGQETGVCQSFDCSPDAVVPDPEPPPDPLSCDNLPTEPVIDASIFPECCDGAHCIPNEFVPTDLLSALTPCPGGASACIPDEFVETGGFFTPVLCSAPGALEGRCLSSCLSFVAEQGDILKKQTCQGNTLCVPCCDPFTGAPTGACDIGCDTGLQVGICQIAFDPCCNGVGHCIPVELIPAEQLENLNDDGCPSNYRCVPDVFTDPNFKGTACSAEIPFVASYTGVCLPKCLDIPLDFLIGSGTCGGNDDCVPCVDPVSGQPTGAPGC
jgi:hypothetical protein